MPEQLYRDALERLAVAAELREDAFGRHAYRVGKLAGLLANALVLGTSSARTWSWLRVCMTSVSWAFRMVC